MNQYGPTEACVLATVFAGPTTEVEKCGAVPIGRPTRWRECYVMTPSGEPQLLRRGATGELWLAGAGLATGYLNMPEKTDFSFVAHPVDPSRKAYRTGDLVSWTESGHLLYAGRIATQVKLRGLRIDLSEVEGVLQESNSVTEAAVVMYT